MNEGKITTIVNKNYPNSRACMYGVAPFKARTACSRLIKYIFAL